MQNSKFKYGLKNASTFLKHLKEEKQLELNNQIETVYENTFIEQTYMNHSDQLQHVEEEVNQNQIDQKQSLADLVVREHLKQTMLTYEQDLLKLEQNRENIIDAIQQLSQKIQGLPDLHTKNQNLELQNFKQRKEIQMTIKDHHQMKLELCLKKSNLHSKFLKKKQKLRKLIEILEPELEERVYIESWEQYLHQINKNKYDAHQDSGQIKKEIEEKIIEKLLNKNKGQKKQKSENREKPQKFKKQRDGMLGDLKNFAKNFKMP